MTSSYRWSSSPGGNRELVTHRLPPRSYQRLQTISSSTTFAWRQHPLISGCLPAKRRGREKRSAVKRMRPLTSYLRSSSGLSSPDLKTQPICPVHPSSFPRPRRREGKGRCTRNPSVYSLFLLLPEQKGRREETKRRDGWSVS